MHEASADQGHASKPAAKVQSQTQNLQLSGSGIPGGSGSSAISALPEPLIQSAQNGVRSDNDWIMSSSACQSVILATSGMTPSLGEHNNCPNI